MIIYQWHFVHKYLLLSHAKPFIIEIKAGVNTNAIPRSYYFNIEILFLRSMWVTAPVTQQAKSSACNIINNIAMDVASKQMAFARVNSVLALNSPSGRAEKVQYQLRTYICQPRNLGNIGTWTDEWPSERKPFRALSSVGASNVGNTWPDTNCPYATPLISVALLDSIDCL